MAMTTSNKPRVNRSDPKAPPRRYPRGSEWRKWDLHVHAPGTKLSDGYGKPIDLDRFCRTLELCDVQVFGITDYFSADGFYAVADKYHDLFPDSEKVLFPNVELRLNESVNGSNQIVDIHLVFRPDEARETIARLLGELKTQITDANDRHLRCNELTTETHFQQATVTREDLTQAIEETFGKAAIRADNVLIIVPSNNNGIRAGGGQQRKANLADQIDKMCDGIFGNSSNVEYFLRTNRAEDATQKTRRKPVFACCDAHSFDDLDRWLGKAVKTDATQKEVTWIKADPTFEGLQQTLVEPKDRVCIPGPQRTIQSHSCSSL